MQPRAERNTNEKVLWLAFSFFIVGFLFLATLVGNGGSAFLDDWGLHLAREVEGTSFLVVLEWVSFLASKSAILAISLLTMFLLILLKRDFIGAVTMFLLVMGGNGVNKLVKEWIGRERPALEVEGFSFPSGHVMIGLIMYGFIVYFLLQVVSSSLKRNVLLMSTMFIMLLVGMSRFMLGEHFVTDVLAGYFLGGAMLVLGVIVNQIIRRKMVQKDLNV